MIFITLELIDPEKCFWCLDPCFGGQGTSCTHIQSGQTNRVAKFNHQGCQIHVCMNGIQKGIFHRKFAPILFLNPQNLDLDTKSIFLG